jgi:hypothetical protein
MRAHTTSFATSCLLGSLKIAPTSPTPCHKLCLKIRHEGKPLLVRQGYFLHFKLAKSNCEDLQVLYCCFTAALLLLYCCFQFVNCAREKD